MNGFGTNYIDTKANSIRSICVMKLFTVKYRSSLFHKNQTDMYQKNHINVTALRNLVVLLLSIQSLFVYGDK